MIWLPYPNQNVVTPILLGHYKQAFQDLARKDRSLVVVVGVIYVVITGGIPAHRQVVELLSLAATGVRLAVLGAFFITQPASASSREKLVERSRKDLFH